MMRAEAWAARWLSGWAGLVAVLGLTLILALPGFFTVPPVDRDEVLFAQSSRQMLETGNVIDIRFADQPRYKKPVGIYWLQATAAALTGAPEAIWSYRLVSLLGALASVALTWGIARRALTPAGAVLAAMILGSSLILGVEARLAKTDAMLLATILVSQWALARLWLPGGRSQVPQAGWPEVAAFWVGLAASVLIKGPIGLMVVGFTLAGLCLLRRDLAVLWALRPKWGLLIFAALVLPWLIAITLTSQGAFWTASVGKDLVGKLATGQESHGAPPGSYLAAVWLTFWPGSMLLLAALPGLWALRRHPVMALALVWLVPTWLVFEATTTKLLHYTMPTYPALALVVALAVTEARLWRSAAWVLTVLPVMLLAAVAVAARQKGLALPWSFWPAALLAAVLPALVPLALRRAGPWLVSAALAASAFGLALAVYPTLAAIPELWPARSLARIAAEHPGCALTVAGFAEPSLVFWTGQQAALATPEAALTALTLPGCQLVALPSGAAQPGLVPLQHLTGISLGSGRSLDLAVYLKPE